MRAELSVIVPTLNERDNIPILVERLEQRLRGIDWEVVFVDDDSSDGSLELLKELAWSNPRVRFIQRVRRRGLSSACLEGMASSASPYLAVMDADLQHDEALLPDMLAQLRAGRCDIVVGSRYMDGGSCGAWTETRKRISRLATGLARRLLRVELTDPMSGFFMIRREVFERTVHDMAGQGFKILLDMIAAGGGMLRVRELPFTFAERRHGQSKLDIRVAWEFALLIVERLVGAYLPVRFIMFIMVGGLGAFLHLSILASGLYLLSVPFMWAQGGATTVAMTVNYLLNNVFTYRDQRLRGGALATGLTVFMAVCSVGAVVNVAIATRIFAAGLPWWLAGLIGATIGAVWNFTVSTTLVWGRGRKGARTPKAASLPR